MKFTHRWLLEHIECDLSPQVIGDKLTMAGLELDALVDLSKGLEGVFSGVLEEVGKHPNADRLTVCRVGVGGETLQIVCGATNHKTGDKVVVATIGATLPNGLHIKKSKLRGELSEGMLCSLSELGIAGDSDGILILPEETPDGLPIAQILGKDDHLYELDLTPNRGDCLGVRGIARELGALIDLPLIPIDPIVRNTPANTPTIQIHDREGCPRYSGRIIRDITIAPSPDWLKNRLQAVGLRSINNVVDSTNFVLLDLNQPLHAFDLKQLQLPIQIRRAHPGEVLRTLDEQDRILDDQMTVVADQKQALALGGIMGGETSGVVETTTDIFLESAFFDPIRTARTGRKLSILSDSRYRFERGVDPDGIQLALDRATQLIIEIAGGVAEPAAVMDSGSWPSSMPIPFRPERANQLGGINLSSEEMEQMLSRLGCQKTSIDTTSAYYPPSHRHDIKLEEDLVEEIIRLYGYDRVTSSLPRLMVNASQADPVETTQRAIRRILPGMGYFEAINYAFVSIDLQKQFDPNGDFTALLNPISEDQAVMRTTLVAGLMENARRNLSRGNLHLKLFELGQVFLSDKEGGLTETQRLAGLLSGSMEAINWHIPEREADFFDLKGDLENILNALGKTGYTLQPGGPDFLHPGQRALILSQSGNCVGWIGQIHPTLQEQLDPPQPIQLFEMDIDFLIQREPNQVVVQTLSRFPAVERDFAFVVDESVAAQPFLDTVKQTDPDLIHTTTLFDVYTGKHVPSKQKSLALRVTLQANDRTLTESEAQAVSERIIHQVSQRFGATLRS